MDIHENEEQLNEIDPTPGESQALEESMDKSPEVGEELQPAPEAEVTPEEESSLEADVSQDEELSLDIFIYIY